MFKKVFSLIFLSVYLFSKTDLNINLSIPLATGEYNKLPQYNTKNTNNSLNVDSTNPLINGVVNTPDYMNNNLNKNITNSNNKEIKKESPLNLKMPQSNSSVPVKIVSSDVIKNLDKDNYFNNICEAFVSDNSNNAFDFGYKKGIEYTKLYIGKFLLKHKKELDILFPLKELYLDNGILQPPLIGKEDEKSYIYENGNVYRKYGVKYYIKEPARFVTDGDYKKWEDFLLDYPVEYYYENNISNILSFNFDVKYSNNPFCNKKIKDAVFKKFREGFVAGEKEVFLLMDLRLKKLQNFLDELYLYNELYYRGVINPPLISEFIEPVYKNQNGKILVINEKVLKIVKPATFNTETKKWKVFLITNDKITVSHIKVKE